MALDHGIGVRIPASQPNPPLRLSLDRTSTPIGELMVVADALGHLCATHWSEDEPELLRTLARQYRGTGYVLEPARNPGGVTARIDAYFAGELTAIDTVPVAFAGTVFQRAVWTALRGIPCGSTTSYSALARGIGRPRAVRAVGLANGQNPVSVVVPCHRVIGADGRLVGYGGGIERKKWLLAHEAAAGQAWPIALR